MTGFALIPADLRALPQWVCWRLERRNGKATKVPYSARRPSSLASTTDSATWAPFEDAVEASSAADGVGFVFSDRDPYAGVDLDDCVDGGRLHPAAAAIVLRLGSYTEVSPSGRGVKTIVRASLNGFPRNRTGGTGWGGEFEVYDRARFFTLTGRGLRGGPSAIEPRQQQLDAVLARVFGTCTSPEPPRSPAQPVTLDDHELLDRAFASRSGGRVRALWQGQWEGLYGSRSEADLALCRHLVFWTGGDPGRVEQLFRRSGLYRAKWEREDYRARTIGAALR